ncbi:MAG: dihydropteroate synthase [Bacteroidetes bacterium]|nr:dihydropteroate synthase [Bacteroidota bacterium]
MTPLQADRFFQEPESLLLLGIVNITPDSFSDGGAYLNPEKAVQHALSLLDSGAGWLDLGAESTRPGSLPVPSEEEWHRLEPVIRGILTQRPGTVLSVDTTKSRIAEQAVSAGCQVVNDISGGTFDPEMIPVVARLGVPMILMHTGGKPETMQMNPVYQDVTEDVCRFLEAQAKKARAAGIQNLILDPGFGFGKTLRHNYELLSRLDQVTALGYPVLAGISRKRMIGQVTGREVTARETGSRVAETLAAAKGARIFRVHDAAGASDMIRILNAFFHPESLE